MSGRARNESAALGIAVAASVALHALALGLGGLARHAHQFEPPRVLSVLLPEREPPAPKVAPPLPIPAKAEPAPPKQKAPAPPPKPARRVEETRPILTAREPSPAAPAAVPVPPPAPPASVAAPAPAPAAAAPAAPGAGTPAGAGESVVPPSYRAAYLQNPAPRYPASARRSGEEGTVRLKVFVTSEGKPAKVELERTSGSAVLDAAAADAVAAWRFVPARRGGEAVEAWVVVPIVFRLEAAN
jgi:protein TonB